jgi:hypothetical protein
MKSRGVSFSGLFGLFGISKSWMLNLFFFKASMSKSGVAFYLGSGRQTESSFKKIFAHSPAANTAVLKYWLRAHGIQDGMT